MEEKFTINEIRSYLQNQNSFGDVMYNLSAVNIKIANLPDEVIFEDDDMECIDLNK